MPFISEANARALCATAFTQLGMSAEDAAIVADNQVFASLRGIDTHGIFGGLPGYLGRIKMGAVRPGTDIRIVRENDTIATVDAGAAAGAVSGVFCMDLAIEKARKHGLGAVAAYNCNHYGAASYYAVRALAHDMVGLTVCNGTPRVVPFGGREGLLGANPISFAIPSQDTWPIIGDMSTSIVAAGQLAKARRRGQSIPLGWALDLDGNPTTDPEVGGRGLLLPMGGHKGYALSLLVSTLAGALTGGLVGREIPRDPGPDSPNFVSHFFMAINAPEFSSTETFTGKVSTLVRDAKSVRPAEGVAEVLVPGEPELRTERERRQTGIPCTDREWQGLKEALARHGLDADDLERRYGPTATAVG
jgi:LDH2 family malate/lactate/ureidoglycolate dehydrogenase